MLFRSDTWVDEQFRPPPQVEDCECTGRMRTAEFFGLTEQADELAQAYARQGPLSAEWVKRLFDLEWPRSARVVGACLSQEDDVLKDFQPEALDWGRRLRKYGLTIQLIGGLYPVAVNL